MIMAAMERPMRTIVMANAPERNDSVVLMGLSAAAMFPPEEDATMRVTIGRSQTPVIFARDCSCRVILYI
jgi:hypothetical protein